MANINWMTADRREWNVDSDGVSNYIFPSFSAETLAIVASEIMAREICVAHNYLLAQERRPKWDVDVWADDRGWSVWDMSNLNDIKPISDPVPTRLAAMADFVMLDLERIVAADTGGRQ